MDKVMKIAVILTAMDQMSSVIDNSVNKSLSSLDKLHKAQKSLTNGLMLIGAGREGLDSLNKFKDAFADLQEAGNEMKTSMMGPGGVLDSAQYDKVIKSAQSWSDVYKAPTAQYLDMIRVMKNNRLDVKDIMGGIGESAAQLSDLFNMNPSVMGEFSARMKNDMGVRVDEMNQMMDLVARIWGTGVGKSGEESVNEMTEFYSKIGLGLSNLHIQGLQTGKEAAILGSMFMNMGLSGQTVGNNFRRILDGMRDPERINKVLNVAKLYGKSLEFYNRDGKFLGIENMVMQLGKLQGLDPNKIAKILNPFSGKQGLSTDFLEKLANYGTTQYPELLDKINNQATMQEKLKVIMGGLNYEQDAYHASLENLKASIGQNMEPILIKVYESLHRMSIALRQFVQQYPTLTKIALGFVAIGSALLILAGTIKVLFAMRAIMQLLSLESFGLGSIMASLRIGIESFGMTLLRSVIPAIVTASSAVWTFTAALLANPITWIVVAIVALAAGIYLLVKNWDIVKVYLSHFWTYIVGKWNQNIELAKNIFIAIKLKILSFFTWIKSLPSIMYESGKSFITNLWNGITNKAQWLLDKVKNIAQKIRNLWPFSPAKEGPLRDIHRIKLMETIAATIRPQPVLVAMQRAVGNVASFSPSGGRSVYTIPSSNNASYNVHFSPVINLSGSATKEDAQRISSHMEVQFRRMMDNYYKEKLRKGY